MEAYCVKCREKRPMQDAEATFTSTGTPATKGVCAVCGTKLFRMGRTDAHAKLTPPEIEPALLAERRKKKQAKKRKGRLVIVESPAKARTVGRYLGKGYRVKASVGHVRDLLKSKLSVDVENNFEPRYRVPNEKREVVKELKKDAAQAEQVFIATDPDREGEAIAWHLLDAAEIEPEITKRVVFHEITKKAIEDAFNHPRDLDMNLVDAQQARRILDRLVGYNLSPLLWSKVRSRLSAGRVQSVALRLVVEREREIENFVPQEYWSIDGEFIHPGKPPSFKAKLLQVNNEGFEAHSEADIQGLLRQLRRADFQVKDVKRGTRTRKQSAPFTTSTLQQDASRRLKFTARKTMAVAQQLYEGIDISPGGTVGLITYMRTDSTQVSEQAQHEARELIQERYGADYLPEKPPIYRTKTKRAQEAHEAVRPTSVRRHPDDLKSMLSKDQLRLYKLIWSRFVASQMRPAVYDTLVIDVEGKDQDQIYLFRVTASSLRFKGFLAVYEEAQPKQAAEKKAETKMERLPALEVGDPLTLLDLFPEQHFTQPPPRYSDASLVREMEEYGIGRPSTYAPIITTLQRRGYVRRDKRRMIPTEVGVLVNDLLVEHFPNVVDLGFTARLENDLDDIADGERQWVDVVRQFYEPFEKKLQLAWEQMPEVKAEPEMLDRMCPACGNPLLVRYGRFGKFIGCSHFPDCRFTEPWLEKIGVACPEDGGDLVERRTRKGRIFYGCSNYPECEYTSWKRPLSKPCPQCGGLLVVDGKDHAMCTVCETRFERSDVEPEQAESAVA